MGEKTRRTLVFLPVLYVFARMRHTPVTTDNKATALAGNLVEQGLVVLEKLDLNFQGFGFGQRRRRQQRAYAVVLIIHLQIATFHIDTTDKAEPIDQSFRLVAGINGHAIVVFDTGIEEIRKIAGRMKDFVIQLVLKGAKILQTYHVSVLICYPIKQASLRRLMNTVDTESYDSHDGPLQTDCVSYRCFCIIVNKYRFFVPNSTCFTRSDTAEQAAEDLRLFLRTPRSSLHRHGLWKFL